MDGNAASPSLLPQQAEAFVSDRDAFRANRDAFKANMQEKRVAHAQNLAKAAWVDECSEVLHDAYERAAVVHGWETNPASRHKPWADVPDANKATMRTAVRILLGFVAARVFETLLDDWEYGDCPGSKIKVGNQEVWLYTRENVRLWLRREAREIGSRDPA
jgi:hypothetical protein